MGEEIRDELSGIVGEAIDTLKPSREDTDALIRYGAGAATALIAAKVASTPEEKASALKQAQGFQDAISLVVARYEILAGTAAEKAFGRVVRKALSLAIAALL